VEGSEMGEKSATYYLNGTYSWGKYIHLSLLSQPFLSKISCFVCGGTKTWQRYFLKQKNEITFPQVFGHLVSTNLTISKQF
jgi:hypothetical protein